MLGIDALLEMADKLGVINAVKAKLIMNPDPAADKLVTALEELAKIFESLNSELSRYLSITFYDGQGFKERAEERSNLVELEGGQVTARMARARGHCKKIINIYNKYLTPWFANVLNPQESQDMHGLFQLLERSDYYMVDAIKDAAIWLSKEAEDTLYLVDASKFNEADEKIKKARVDILPKRKAIGKALTTLFELQSEFVGISGTTK